MMTFKASPVFSWAHEPLDGAVHLMGMSFKSEDLTFATLEQALAGDSLALGVLIDRLTPVLHVRVARTLLRRMPSSSGQRLRQEVEDLVQDVMVSLFADDARVLRTWDQDKGLSLANFVGMVAERQVFTILQSRRKTWPAEFRAPEDLDRATSERDPEQRASARQRLSRLVSLMKQDLSAQGFTMFKLLFVDELTVSEIGESTGMKADAIYAWRSRLRTRTRRLMRCSETTSKAGRSPMNSRGEGHD